jgi:hypothetical protein
VRSEGDIGDLSSIGDCIGGLLEILFILSLKYEIGGCIGVSLEMLYRFLQRGSVNKTQDTMRLDTWIFFRNTAHYLHWRQVRAPGIEARLAQMHVNIFLLI